MARALSSTVLLFASLLNSSQANQKSMFSSLNSVRRNCRKEFLPAGQHISLSNDCPHEWTSSSVGLGLPTRQNEQLKNVFSRSGGQNKLWFTVFPGGGVYQSSQSVVPSLISEEAFWLLSSRSSFLPKEGVR